MLRNILRSPNVVLALFLMAVSFQRVSAANVMNYGADGNDYFQFTAPSMSFDKASGFTTLITFAMHVNPDGTLLIGGVACTNGVYVGPTNWGSLVATLKAPPTTVNRYEVCIGGWQDTSYDNVKSLVASQGTGPGSMLYKNFLALKNAVPGIDAINDDDERTYDLNSSTNFANMLGGLGYKFTMVPYTAQSFWVNLRNDVTNCDFIYLQCYEGGAGNDPGQWDTAFGNGVVVIPGQESNTAIPGAFHNWYLETGVQGGFYYPDMVFNSTYWSAVIIEGNGAVAAVPAGLVATHGENQVVLSWMTAPGAISYNIKRSTSSGGEATIANVSTASNNWPVSNQYTDSGLTTGKPYYYKVSAVNTNGESPNSVEVSATPPPTATWTGLGPDNNWGTAGNWNTAPSFPTGLIFAGSTRLTSSNNLTSITVDSITFDSAADPFVLGGSGITLNGNIGFTGNPATPVTQTVDLNMAWSPAALDVDAPINGKLTFGGAITSSADYSLNKTGAGTLTLGGTNSIAGMGVNGGTNLITGSTTINGNGDGNDRIYVADGDFLNGCKGTLVIQPGATLAITGAFGDQFVIGRDSGSGTVIQNGGTFTFNPSSMPGGNLRMLVGATGSSATRAEYDMNAGLLNLSGCNLSVGWGNQTGTTGLLNQVGGVITNVYELRMPTTGGGSGWGVYTLSGGSLYILAGGIVNDGPSYVINLGGGTVGAGANWSSSLNLTLTGSNGPVTFDTAASTITLSGVLSGNGGLTKVGLGILDLSGANTYKGDTTVNAGILKLEVAGSSQAAYRLTNGASLNLNFAGTSIVNACYTNGVAIPNGTYSASNLHGFIAGTGSLEVAGPVSAGLWTGGGVNNNWSTGGNWDHNVVPVFPIGLTFAGGTRLVNSNDLVGITVNKITFDSAAGPFVLNGNNVTNSGSIGFNGNPSKPVTQTVNLNMALSASQNLDTPANGNLILGGVVISANDLTKLDTGTLTLAGTNAIENLDVDGGTNIVTGNTIINGNGGGGNYDRIYVGDGDVVPGCNGTLVIQPGAALAVTGNFNDTFVIGRDGGSGTVIQNGGTFTFNPANISLMLICATDVAGTAAAYDMNGGLFNMGNKTLGVGFAVNGAVTTGMVNQVGGVITNLNTLDLGPQESGGLGIYTLTGGNIYLGAGGITTAGGIYAINLGGGTVGAYTSWASSLSMNLTGSNGPVTFDTAGNTITLSGSLYGYGGLTKTGSGTLILSGGASYLGNTVVNAGALQLNLAGTSPGALYLTNGASLNLTSGGTYTVGALYTNNVALPNGIYTSGNLPGFITGTNALQVMSIAIGYSLSGSNLTLSWPANYLGWFLQEQTNALTVGANANWVDLAGSANVTSTNIAISPATPTAFFRLRSPLPPSIPPLSRQIYITNNLLNLPVNNNGPSRRVTIMVGGVPVRDFDINLADGPPEWWAFVDVSEFQGQTATVSVDNLSVGSTGLSSIVQSNGIVGATNLYSESLRPQVHYSSRRGLINDVNGMIYDNGQYNLYYQHNPYKLDFSANGAERTWGHAVSPDMVHWQELPEAIYPHGYGDWVWSGSAVIDSANTGGFKTGTNDVIVASFYSTARGQCIAYSNDGGLTFTDYTNNPVVTVAGRDPHMLWYAPSNYWVMAVYDSNLNGIDFFSTPDFHNWTYRSGIGGFAECPDIFQLPVDGNTNNMLWEINGGSASYMLGTFNGAVFTPTTGMLPGNAGSGFYASQTFTVMPAGDTRRVRMGWAQVNMPGMPFTGMHFFPTELALQTLPTGVRLCSTPIAEITNAVQNTYSWTNLTLNPGNNPLSGITGQLFDVRAQFTPGSASTITFNLCGVSITYAPASEQISCNGVTNPLPPINGAVTLEVITDCQSVEIFGNSGQLYMPIVTTPYSPTDNYLSLNSQGASTVFNYLVVNQLKSIWPGAGD